MILHIDMDAFYASIEEIDNPILMGKCVIVGRDSTRGVVSTANYKARKFGVHSAMPIYKAKKLCPKAIIISPNIRRYKAVSDQVMNILGSFSPLVEKVSIDEAYLDISGMERIHGKPEELGKKIKAKIKERLNLTCSVGIAPNKFLSKIASDMKKPNGLTYIKPDKALSFARSLEVRKIPGVGHETKKYFDKIGVKILGDILKVSNHTLTSNLGKRAKRLVELANCIDNSPVFPSSPSKSISVEKTLEEDTKDKSMLLKYLLEQSENVGWQLRKLNFKAKSITIKIKHSDFKQVTRSATLFVPTSSSDIIYGEAKRLFLKYRVSKSIRLIGVKVSSFLSDKIPIQKELFENDGKNRKNWEKVEKTVDKISGKFGKNIVKRASLKW